MSESIVEQFGSNKINNFSLDLYYLFYRFFIVNQKENFGCI